MESTSLQERLRNEDPSAFEEIYKENREAFFNYALKFNLDRDTVLDIYQDATIALYQNFVTKQIELDRGSLKTYLFAIGKYKIYDALKFRQKVVLKEVPNETFEHEIEEVFDEQQKQLAISFDRLSESCQEILKMY